MKIIWPGLKKIFLVVFIIHVCGFLFFVFANFSGAVEIKEFKRWAKNPATEIHDGFLKPAELEIIRLDNDSSLPENGKINFIMLGGL